MDTSPPSRADTDAREETRLLRFRVAQADVALFAIDVEEVSATPEITPIPCAPGHVPGVVALRGEPLPLFDVALFLGLSTSLVEEPRMLVVRSPEYRVGLLCEHVRGVVSVAGDELRAARVSRPPALRRYAAFEVELAHGVVPVLDLSALLRDGRAR